MFTSKLGNDSEDEAGFLLICFFIDERLKKDISYRFFFCPPFAGYDVHGSEKRCS
jgi:hypothetical protein